MNEILTGVQIRMELTLHLEAHLHGDYISEWSALAWTRLHHHPIVWDPLIWIWWPNYGMITIQVWKLTLRSRESLSLSVSIDLSTYRHERRYAVYLKCSSSRELFERNRLTCRDRWIQSHRLFPCCIEILHGLDGSWCRSISPTYYFVELLLNLFLHFGIHQHHTKKGCQCSCSLIGNYVRICTLDYGKH